MLNELFQPRHSTYTMDSIRKAERPRFSRSSPSYLSTHRLYSTPLSWQRRFPGGLGSLSLLTAVPYSTLLIAPITARACRCWDFTEQSTVKQLSIWNPDVHYCHNKIPLQDPHLEICHNVNEVPGSNTGSKPAILTDRFFSFPLLSLGKYPRSILQYTTAVFFEIHIDSSLFLLYYISFDAT